MTEFYKDGRYLGEFDDDNDDDESSMPVSAESIFVKDPMHSLFEDYREKATDKEKASYLRGLRLTLSLPDVSQETKNDINAFLRKLEQNSLEN